MGRGHFSAPVEDPPDRYRMDIPLGTVFRAETLRVSLKDHVMTIKAKLNQGAGDGHPPVRQKFIKKFRLPSNVDMLQVRSVLSPEGYLRVDAPLRHDSFPHWIQDDNEGGRHRPHHHHHHPHGEPFNDVDVEVEAEIPIHIDDNNNHFDNNN